ncbi:MAG: hydrogenase nickel incorporation protein HypB [Gammaproteobacteria bacterium]
MCTTCGCSDGAKATVTDLATGKTRSLGTHTHDHDHDGHHEHEHDHEHAHDHHHGHDHSHAHGTTISLEQEVLARNNRLAERNRGWLEGRNILALNLVSSPGAGKTTLLERTIRDLGQTLPVCVLEGDQETVFDAERIRATGCKTLQINTGTGCHLEAGMLAQALKQLDPPLDSLLMIENVGNLVCPALFDLGEAAKVVILSVTEGADKPLKYPHMFRASGLMILNKTDLLPHVDFDVDTCLAYARRINPDIEVLQLSATTGEGLDDWYAWLRARLGKRMDRSLGVGA